MHRSAGKTPSLSTVTRPAVPGAFNRSVPTTAHDALAGLARKWSHRYRGTPSQFWMTRSLDGAEHHGRADEVSTRLGFRIQVVVAQSVLDLPRRRARSVTRHHHQRGWYATKSPVSEVVVMRESGRIVGGRPAPAVAVIGA